MTWDAYYNMEPNAKRARDGDGLPPPKPKITPGRYKIVQCRNFSQTGTCRFGDQCTYAHGSEEQAAHRQLSNLPFNSTLGA